MKNNEIRIFPNPQDLFLFAAKDFSDRAKIAVEKTGAFSVVLAGGETPKLFFDTLAGDEYCKNNTPWPLIQFYFGDERYVPADDINSNYHLADEHLFSKLPINPDNIHRIPTDFDAPRDAAADYEKILRKAFHLQDKDCPAFDLFYLGLGDNAHTASLMPYSKPVKHYLENSVPDNHYPLVEALFVPELNMNRITLTPRIINQSKNIIFMVTGSKKALALREVLEGQTDPQHYPAQLIHSMTGKTIWYLDSAAAEKLTKTGAP